MPDKIRFGPAGNPDGFYDAGGKSSLEMPAYLAGMGLSAYEYQCGRGVRISKDSAEQLGQNARRHDVALSVHAPYFTNISSPDPEKIDGTVSYIMQSAAAARAMGAGRVAVHMGSPAGMTRKEALDISKRTMHRALAEMDAAGYGEVSLCPETMGKINQMGTLGEVLELCTLDERLIPAIDFGHLYSRSLGGINTVDDYAAILDAIQNALGGYRAKSFHCHFSKQQFTAGGGEKKHLKFSDVGGPDFAPLAELIRERALTPVIICESAGTQAEDALIMKGMVI